MIVSRFAPAPTGYLHLGHVVNAIYVWGITRARGGRVLLRIEDHDRQRRRAEYEAAIVADLAWLGFSPDGPTHASAPTDDVVGADPRVRLVRQSERGAIYDAALDGLRAAGLVYACECSRAEIAAAARASDAELAVERTEANERRYPGTCADKRLAESPGLGLRVRLEPTTEHFMDLRHGPQTQRPSEQCGDLLVKDRDGNWTYQFAATVDDLVQGVTCVVRGDDLLASTGRQIQLARLLGRETPPEFLHHALVMKSPDQKLSKSDGDTGVRDFRARGCSAEHVIGYACALAGLICEPRDVRADDVPSMMSACKEVHP